MPPAHPVIQRNLVERYEALNATYSEYSTPGARRELDDVAHLLCLATGTGDVDAALVAAAHEPPGAGVADGSMTGRVPSGNGH